MTMYIISEWVIDDWRDGGLSKSLSISSPIPRPVSEEDLRSPRL